MVCSWHYSDEENFSERKSRVLKALDFIISLGRENVLVGTHGSFLRMAFGAMLFGRDLNLIESRRLASFLQLSNAGVTLFEYSDKKWNLVTWNDLAHLAE